MKLTYRVDRRKRGLDNLARMYESLGAGKGRRTVSIQAGIFDTSRRTAGTKLFQGKAHKILEKLTNAAVASLQEYGTSTIPARPFIGPPLKMFKRKYVTMIVAALKDAMKAEREVPKSVWRKIGAAMKRDIKDYVLKGDGVPPPNAPSTLAHKRGDRTLVDSKQMIKSVDYRVVTNT